MTKTEDSLKKALAGESQANRRYLAFADKAEKDGYPQVARLFRAAADAETVHALSVLRVMRGVKSTAENLVAAIEGETYEYTEMYPSFVEAAKEEGRRDAVNIFEEAGEVEKSHASYYSEALEAVKKKKDLPATDYYVCQVCGYTAKGEAPDKCPVCGSAKKYFKKIEK